MIEIFAVKTFPNINSQREGIRKILDKRLGVNSYRIIKTLSGKPYLAGRSDLYINMSHSYEYTICAFAPCEIGIDIEKIRDINPRLIEKFVRSPDSSQTLSLTEPISEWTKQESYGKFTGEGLFTSEPKFPHIYKQYNDIDGYLITVCVGVSGTGGLIVSDPDFPEHITWYQE